MPHLANINFNFLRKKPYLLLLTLGCIGAIAMYCSWGLLTYIKPWGLRLFFDSNDLNVYFRSSRWVVDQGILYKDIFSEYPLLAGLIFGIVRYLAKILHPFSSEFDSFSWLWMSINWFIYLWIIYLVATRLSKPALWIWLAPAPLYFTLLRFDIYPALMTLLALFAIHREKYVIGAIWLGLSIALKGYALFCLPAYFVFIYYRKGFFHAIKIIAICLAPFILSQLIVFAFAGIDGVKQPYLFHINRNTNNESTYDAIAYLLPFHLTKHLSNLDKWLQLSTAILAAVFKPKSFDALVHAFLFAIVGFISFSIFHSPQYVLWIVAIACFSPSRWINLCAIAYSWVVFLYFPLTSDRHHHTTFYFKLIVILMTAVRLPMLYLSFRELQNKAKLKYRSIVK
ncbi:MAG TPA: hypothetical protein V6D09_07650 [Leptolyngbyaceae cyanobacterium]